MMPCIHVDVGRDSPYTYSKLHSGLAVYATSDSGTYGTMHEAFSI